MKAKFSAAIFDMDGLLLDSERPIRDAWIQVCSESGVNLTEEDYRGAIGRNARDSRAHMEAVCGAAFDYDLASSQVAAILKSRFGEIGYPLKDGAVEILTWLRDRGVPTAVASSSNHHEIASRLHKAGIASFFSALAGGDEVNQGKPAPDLYLLAAQRLGVDRPEDCLAFEDSEPGAEAAITAGMGVVIVPDLRPPSVAALSRSVATLASLRDAITDLDDWIDLYGLH